MEAIVIQVVGKGQCIVGVNYETSMSKLFVAYDCLIIVVQEMYV